MSENLSLDETIAKLKAEAQEALKNVIAENKQRFEASLTSRQQHLIEKLNPDLIKFNVGGCKFVTTLATLSNIKDTKLHKMATGRYPIALDKKNRIFIDRNGQYFGYVLDCLRKGKVELPSDSFLSNRVQKEFEFFELVNVSKTGSSSSPNQKEEKKVNSPEKLATPSPSLFGAAKPLPSGSLFGAKPIAPGFGQIPIKIAAPPVPFGTQPAGLFGSKLAPAGVGQFAKVLSQPAAFTSQTKTASSDPTWTEGERQWRFAKGGDELGGYCCPDRILIEAENLDYQTIGETLLSSGTHQWRLFTEEFVQPIPNKVTKKAFVPEGIVTFGVVTKEIWKKVQQNRDFTRTCSFNTIGETFRFEVSSKKKKGLKVDGPELIKEIGCKNQEFTLTFNTQTGVLKLSVKGQEKSHMLRINESAGNEYYPYFHIENARLRLLESRELAENEQAGMDFVLEEDEPISGDDEDDYEDVDSDDS